MIYRNTIGFILASSSLAIGLFSLAGHVMQVMWMASWGNAVPMALSTSVAVILVSSAVMAYTSANLRATQHHAATP